MANGEFAWLNPITIRNQESLGRYFGRSSIFANDIKSKATEEPKRLAGALSKLQSVLDAIYQCGAMKKAPDAATHFVNGVEYALRAMNAAGNTSGPIDLTMAAQSFDKAWFRDEKVFPRAEHVKTDVGMQSLNQPQGQACSAAGYWTACNLLADWAIHQQLHQKPTFSASTPVLTANTHFPIGVLFDLTVTLEEYQAVERIPNPICPDPFSFGLMDISGMIAPIQNAWNTSGLASRFRGRWGLTCRSGFPPCVSGYSVEAAALVAMLAASRDPYGEHTGVSPGALAPCPLYPKAAVTAAVVRPSGEGPACDATLATVGLIPQKIYTAAQGELETIIFVKKDYELAYRDPATEVKRIEEDKKQAISGGSGRSNRVEVYLGLEIESELTTIREVLDVLLEENRHLTRYNQNVRQRWLGQWDGDTGLASIDPARSAAREG